MKAYSILVFLLATACAVPSEYHGPQATHDPLRPTLDWPSFPGERYPEVWGGARDVYYELRVYRVKRGVPHHVVYTKLRLKHPWHQIERRLEPDAEYAWWARAWFYLESGRRVTPWMSTSRRGGFASGRGFAWFHTPPEPRPDAMLLSSARGEDPGP